MNLIVGYQLRPDQRLTECILSHRECIGEVYFAWPGIANGRSVVSQKVDLAPREALNRQYEELLRFSEAGISLNLLLNGNCYGAESLARSFYQRIGDLIDYLATRMRLRSVTTASPIIARFVKENFTALEVRASVNMEIATREGIEYLADTMDGFYVKRELNRSLEKVREFSRIAVQWAKKFICWPTAAALNYCSARQFHDNLVSHEEDLMRMDNAYGFDGLCRQFLANQENRRRILQVSNWIRPEDIRHYEGIVDGIKLATRVSEHPEMIVDAYASGRFSGNLLALTEPDFSSLYYPTVLDAGAFPKDYFEKLAHCRGCCAECDYCIQVFDTAAKTLPEEIIFG